VTTQDERPGPCIGYWNNNFLAARSVAPIWKGCVIRPWPPIHERKTMTAAVIRGISAAITGNFTWGFKWKESQVDILRTQISALEQKNRDID
jgi:hypothetical protein